MTEDETPNRGQDPLDPEKIAEILDAIPGAYEHAQEAREQAERGEVIPLEDL